ncbi:FadR/GntR family transcriptional regulator [Arthrobacter sp. NicSoilB8]|uniref:FadR/GntR family transcriptional regulator n=1 Tax=Arthrobacter sp. NicSoilB8 TaxID=2830998 RepID=UPI001CC51D07|nr:FadR/GntR family transcriptional regulator [Arthrobacter sp. NicSoilB8]BCW73545.1 GntR family transcriptional regulator [Arthrobacter sp. NicSoilB8]
MALSTSPRQPLADEISGKLREMIRSGAWTLHGRIPPERELMAGLGVSRGTLREAIRALAHSGMLDVRRGDGTYVRAPNEFAGAARRAHLDHTQEHILEVRVGLETQAARLCARNATADDVAALRALLTESEDAWLARNYAGWARADWDFHARVAQASANPLLRELYVSFGNLVLKDLLAQHHRPDFDRLPPREGHGQLVDAIVARDGDAAAATVDRTERCAERLRTPAPSKDDRPSADVTNLQAECT